MAPLRGEKGLSYEGGVRVPLFVYWPGVTLGGDVAEPVNLIDFFPTILDLAGVPRPAGQPVDGVSLVPLLRGAAMPELRDRPHFWYNVTSGLTARAEPFQPVAAVRQGNWRLLKPFGQRLQLYDLSVDPGESRNLAAQHPAVAQVLEKTLDDWLEDTGVALPTVNPFYQPNYVIPKQVELLPVGAVLLREWKLHSRESGWRAAREVELAFVRGALRMQARGLYPEIASASLDGLPAGRYAVQLDLRLATAGRVRLRWDGSKEPGNIELFPRRDGRWHTLTSVFDAQEPLRGLRVAAPTHLLESGQYDPATQPDWIDLGAVRLFSLPP
ncbi:MAG: sulfatase-like hydrolase/transferase [Halioglobus sp.]